MCFCACFNPFSVVRCVFVDFGSEPLPEHSGFDLLGALGSATEGTKLGTALKVVSAFSKVEQFIDDLKNIAPEVHQALNANITDITNVMANIIDEIGNVIEPTLKNMRSGLDLLETLGSATEGTKLGTAIKVVNAFSKVEQFINDLKNIAPQVHQTLNSSITDITNIKGNIIDEIGNAIDPSNKYKRSGFDLLGAVNSATESIKLGAVLKVVNAFSKVEQFIDDLNNIAPVVHQALNASITDITNVMANITDEIGNAIDPASRNKRSDDDLLGVLGASAEGTKLGMVVDVISAFGKVEQFINDVKNIAPEVHQALQGSVTDVIAVIEKLVEKIAHTIDPPFKHDQKRSGFNLLGALSSATEGTKLGAALKVVSAFSKVEQFINDIKNIAPEVHQALNANITDITNVISNIIDEIGNTIDLTTKL